MNLRWVLGLLLACGCTPAEKSAISQGDDAGHVETDAMIPDIGVMPDLSVDSDAAVEVDATPTETCEDGERNQNESDVDCGGFGVTFFVD